MQTGIFNDLNNPVAADNIIDGMMKKIGNLKEQSGIGKPLYFGSGIFTGYRFLIYKNYLVFYSVSGNDVYIERVLYAKSDYMHKLFNL